MAFIRASLIFLATIVFSVITLAGNAVIEQDIKSNNIEIRLKKLSSELRCLVCQNSTLADSDAPLAKDLRNEIRNQMQAGKTDDEVVEYLVTRYGDFVRFRPPVNASTALLWFGPFIMLLIGAITLFLVLKKRADE